MGGAGGLAHLPIGNARPVCTAGAFPILCLTTEVTTAPGDNCPFAFPPSHSAPSPLTVLPLYLPLCAPSHPIELVEGPCSGEGVMITTIQAHTIYTGIDLHPYTPGGAGTPTQHSLCLHFDPPTMWAFKTDPLRHFFKW